MKKRTLKKATLLLLSMLILHNSSTLQAEELSWEQSILNIAQIALTLTGAFSILNWLLSASASKVPKQSASKPESSEQMTTAIIKAIVEQKAIEQQAQTQFICHDIRTNHQPKNNDDVTTALQSNEITQETLLPLNYSTSMMIIESKKYADAYNITQGIAGLFKIPVLEISCSDPLNLMRETNGIAAIFSNARLYAKTTKHKVGIIINNLDYIADNTSHSINRNRECQPIIDTLKNELAKDNASLLIMGISSSEQCSEIATTTIWEAQFKKHRLPQCVLYMQGMQFLSKNQLNEINNLLSPTQYTKPQKLKSLLVHHLGSKLPIKRKCNSSSVIPTIQVFSEQQESLMNNLLLKE